MTDVRRDAYDQAAALVTAALADDREQLGDLFDTMPVGTSAALLRFTVTFLHDLSSLRGIPALTYWAQYAARLQTILDNGTETS